MSGLATSAIVTYALTLVTMILFNSDVYVFVHYTLCVTLIARNK